jgi:L-rhamnose mutarotase
MDNHTHQPKENFVKRVGMVIRLRPGCLEEYLNLHADSNPGVRDLLAKYHLENFSIFLHQIGSEWFEFGYYEYSGSDYESDLAALAKEPRNQAWLEVCDPMQLPLENETGWALMKQVYYNG